MISKVSSLGGFTFYDTVKFNRHSCSHSHNMCSKECIEEDRHTEVDRGQAMEGAI